MNFTKNFFCNFKNGQKSLFELGKKFKTPKNAISRKKMIYMISRVFYWTFLCFLARCAKTSNPPTGFNPTLDRKCMYLIFQAHVRFDFSICFAMYTTKSHLENIFWEKRKLVQHLLKFIQFSSFAKPKQNYKISQTKIIYYYCQGFFS